MLTHSQPGHQTKNIETDKLPMGRDFQLSLLRVLLESPEPIMEAIKHLDENMLDDPNLGKIFGFIKIYVSDNGKAPNRQTTVSYIMDVLSRGDYKLREQLMGTLSQIEVSQVEKEFIYPAFKDFIAKKKENEYINLTKKSKRELTIQERIELSSKYVSDLRSIQEDHFLKSVADFSTQNVFEILTKIRIEEANPIKIGVHFLDEVIGGGLKNGRLYLLASGAGGTKSLTTMNLAFNAVEAGKRVAYADLENPPNDSYVRFLSRFSGVSRKRILHNYEILTEEEKDALNKAHERIKKYVIFLPMNMMKGAYLEDLEIKLDEVSRTNPFDIIMIDYLEFFRSRNTNSKMAEHESQAHTYEFGRRLAVKYNVPLWSPIQFNREGIKKNSSGEGAELGDIQGTIKSTQLADVLFKVEHIPASETPDGRAHTVWRILKNRLGVNIGATKIACECDMARMITYSPNMIQKQSQARSKEQLIIEISNMNGVAK